MTLVIVLGIMLMAFIGTPLFVIIGLIALIAYSSVGESSSLIILELNRLATAPALLAIPLFTLAGSILAESKTPKRLINLSNAFFGWLPGGTAIVAIVSCALFTAFTGASGVTIIALGGLIHPILMRERYPENFSLGLLTSSGSLGLLFPPSLPLILYGLISGASIDKLFVAGLVPGSIMLVVLSLYSIKIARGSTGLRHTFSVATALKAVREAAWEIPLPFIILGGIYGGIFTVTEAGAVTAFYVLAVEVFVYRELSLFGDIPRIIKDSMVLVGGILIILGLALGLTGYLINAQVPMQILNYMREYIHSPIGFLMVLNVFLLIVGCMLDIFSAIIVVVPLITPIAASLGIDPIHLGIVFLTNLQIGYITPPVGMSLFIASFRFERPVMRLYRASLPFLVILLLILILITYVPEISLFLLK